MAVATSFKPYGIPSKNTISHTMNLTRLEIFVEYSGKRDRFISEVVVGRKQSINVLPKKGGWAFTWVRNESHSI